MNQRDHYWSRKLALCSVALTGCFVSAFGAGPTLSTRQFFYVGGKYVGAPGKEVMVDQMYVEVLRPQRVTQKYPMLFIHGGSELATNWMSTTYGRTGWADYFLAQGYVVYLVDGPARGRSAWHDSVDGPIRMRSFVPNESAQAADDDPRAKKHTQLEEGEKAARKGDPVYDNFYAGLVPQLDSFVEIQKLTQAAGSALLDKIGPAILLTHSQSGQMGWLLAEKRPKAVKAIVAIEPNGPPFDQGASFEGNTRSWGITDLPLTFSPPASKASDLAPVQEAAPDRPDLARCWKQPDPPRQLPNLMGIPILIVTSESSPHAAYDHCTAKFLTQAGVKNTHIRLEELGIHGNSHHMMLEKNNLDIAAVLQQWISKTVK
jgi:pimeloyl-ACP methyl ester carboxylesterase